jgi:hypothetical protein
LLDPPIEKACCYLEEKHATKSCVARNCCKFEVRVTRLRCWFLRNNSRKILRIITLNKL